MTRKLSDLMEEGQAFGYPQVTNTYIRYDETHQNIIGCCAWGSVILAAIPHPRWNSIGIKAMFEVYRELGYDAYTKFIVAPEEYPANECNIHQAITFLNDQLKWSVADIIDWLRERGL